MNEIERALLREVADLHGIPEGSYNIRENGRSLARNSTEEIRIATKKDKDGIDVFVQAGLKNRSVHIPVLLTESGFTERVYNDFYIGKDADVTIVAGCGIHTDSDEKSRHDGVHTFHLAPGAKVRYVEKHYADGRGSQKEFMPTTRAYVKKGAQLVMESTQLGGVTYTDRKTFVTLCEDAKLVVKEKILTDGEDVAVTRFCVKLKGKNASAEVISRSVARGNSVQKFYSDLRGESACFGHVECDGILLDHARIVSVPEIDAKSPEASLVHEAAVGKIAGEQILKLTTLGLTEKEAEDAIIRGYLK